MVRLSVPGSLRYRDVILCAVASVCRLLRPSPKKQDPSREAETTDFEMKVLSAVSEAFNNVAIHAYRGNSAGAVELEIETTDEGITIRLFDNGIGFDPTAQKVPNLGELPESNMGLHLMRSCMDSVSYRPGDPPREPNRLTLFKRYAAA